MRFMATRSVVLASTLFLGVPSLAVATPIIYVDDARGQIGTVDVATGSSTLIGPAGVTLTDIAFANSGMYGIDFSDLYSVNQSTGHATLVGNFGGLGMNALVGDGSVLIGASFSSGSLYSINPATSVATALIGSNPHPSAGDLAFNGGFLWETATNGVGGTDLLKISVVGNTFTSVDVGQIVGDTNMFGLVTASDGLLYGVDGTTIYRINTATPGASTIVSNYAGTSALLSANGAASATEAAPVPEPATLTLLGTGLLAVARRRLRAKRG